MSSKSGQSPFPLKTSWGNQQICGTNESYRRSDRLKERWMTKVETKWWT